MRLLLLSFILLLAMQPAMAQSGNTKKPADTLAAKIKVVEASCGQCQFKMEGNGCTLAVRIDGKAYFVDGTSIDEHGDAHADDGFCQAIRKAEVKGDIINGRFKSTYFKLLPAAKKEQPDSDKNQ